ncbi:NAD(P)-binding domain-containing protein [Streptomyces virginiae]|uniref:NAD(P)-binding domain-containing protein n=1 Tax=Streptomyces virginiae TaxID=1961 RepID=UPI0036F59099
MKIRTGCGAARVETEAGSRFRVDLEDGAVLTAGALVAASGSFGNPCRPALPGVEVVHRLPPARGRHREPEVFAGQRVVVVGAGHSAAQAAAELARTGRTAPATRAPVKFARRQLWGRDLHFWLTRTGLDGAPARPRPAHAADPARPGRRPLPRPARRGPARAPPRLHRPGRRHGHLGGRDGRKSGRGLSSNTLRGAGRDAARAARRLAGICGGARPTPGLLRHVST